MKKRVRLALLEWYEPVFWQLQYHILLKGAAGSRLGLSRSALLSASQMGSLSNHNLPLGAVTLPPTVCSMTSAVGEWSSIMGMGGGGYKKEAGGGGGGHVLRLEKGRGVKFFPYKKGWRKSVSRPEGEA